MTNEEKQLLLKDLCARLPYDVILDNGIKLRTIDALTKVISGDGSDKNVEFIKPYLRYMSSMTEEEIKKYIKLRHKDCVDVERPTHCCKNSITAVVVTLTSRAYVRYWYNDMVSADTIDFLNSRHFDWRNLIPMELALEAPEEMYKTKTE